MSDPVAADLAQRLNEANERIVILLAQVQEVVGQNDFLRSRCAAHAADLALARRDVTALSSAILRLRKGDDGADPAPADPSPAPSGAPPAAAAVH